MTPIEEFEGAVHDIERTITSLPAARFLARIKNWTPRDVLAHLIGWNRYTIEGVGQLRQGERPFYFDDAPAFETVNARSVERYGSRDRERCWPS